MNLESTNQEESDDSLILGQYAEQAYLDYAVSVVRGRALPEISDGQKPVQRRILYAMDVMGLTSTSRPVKSARVVGDVLGKYHPHGDQAAYDAMVRMAQDFVLRYPLIDGQGNFGSRDGDNAAAMRYTEARLTDFSRILLDELNEGTVDFTANYDGSQQEPVNLPARLPVMLLNGASGIAVGMATEIPSHNLRELANACVALLKKPNLSEVELFTIVPGPDFAGGGQIISDEQDIAHVYSTGRGSLKARARWHIEDLSRGQWQLVVDELPPNTSAQKILESIEDLTNPKPKSGKKSLSADQQQTKTQVLSMLDSVRDESGKEDAVRLVFEPKTGKIDKEEFISMLLVRTGLEGNVSVNLVCIDNDGRPGQRSLREILLSWLEFRSNTVTRRTQYRLDKVTDRIHILEGRSIVYLNIDAVIQTIRESDDPKDALKARFNLSDRQAEDILEMRLRQLAKLEGIRIEQELQEKRQQQIELQDLLNDPQAMRKLIIKEIQADAKKYGDDRRTLIERASKAELETEVVDEPITIIISQKGWLRSRQGHGHDKGQFSFKSGDSLYDIIECRSISDLIAFSNTGRTYTVPAASLPSARGDGQPITSMVALEPQTKIAHMIAGHAQDKYLLGTQNSYGFIAHIKDMASRQHSGKQFINTDGNVLLKPLLIQNEDQAVALLSKKGRFLVVDLAELKTLSGGGKGTILISLESDDEVAQWATVGANGVILSGVYRARNTEIKLSLAELSEYMGKRARKGKLLNSKIKQPTLWSADQD